MKAIKISAVIIGIALLTVGSIIFVSKRNDTDTAVKTETTETTQSTKESDTVIETQSEPEQKPIDWSFISDDGVDEEALFCQLDTDALCTVAEKMQSLVDEEQEEERENPEIIITEGYPRVFKKQQYKEVIEMGDAAILPLYVIIYKSENQGMYEHICAVALSEITNLTFEDESGDYSVWSTSKEYLELFNEYQRSKN